MGTVGNVLCPELNRPGGPGEGFKVHTGITGILVQMDNSTSAEVILRLCAVPLTSSSSLFIIIRNTQFINLCFRGGTQPKSAISHQGLFLLTPFFLLL